MDLGQLAQHMGSDATTEQAARMRQALINAGHDGEDTAALDDGEWLIMLVGV